MLKANTARLVIAGIICIVVSVVLISISGQLFEKNDYQNWQLVQGVFGDVRIVDAAGYFGQYFATCYKYPRTLEAFYSAKADEGPKDDQSIRVTFNDGGTAQVSCYVKVGLPTDDEKRKLLHQYFNGNTKNIIDAVRAHLVNAIKSAGPMMSSSENQASRKTEFNQIVEAQLMHGLYKMRRTEVELNDITETVDSGVDEKGNKILKEKKAKVLATDLVLDKDGKPIVPEPSPLERFGLSIIQFSVTETEYDPKTLEQFAAKKESFLAAERAKAQRQEEVQQRLMIEEKGRRQVAEITAIQNQEKTKAVIQAEMNQEVAVVKKNQAVTEAQQKVEVAKQMQQETETLKAIAKIKVETATLDKQANIAAAEAKQKTIELGGGISDKERILAEYKMNRDIGVAKELSGVKTPSVVILGGKEGSNDLTSNLMNMRLMKDMGILTNPVSEGYFTDPREVK